MAVIVELVIFGGHLGQQCFTTAFATAICIFINYRPSPLFWYI